MNNRPEYNELFRSDGAVSVKMRFKQKSDNYRSMPDYKMEWADLKKLFNPDTGSPFESIFCDGYVCQISKLEIYPDKGELVIVADKVLEMGP